MPTPSAFAQDTADTLDRSACQQITRFLRQSVEHGGHLFTDEERACVLMTANTLDHLLTWQRAAPVRRFAR